MQDSFTIAEIVNKFVEESPTKFETPGQRGHPDTFLKDPLRRLLAGSKAVEGAEKKTGGRPARSYAKEDIATALNALKSELEKSPVDWKRAKATEIEPIIQILIAKLKRS